MPRKPGKLRIIAGKWRGRLITLNTDVALLRPTADRVREDLFNWLAPHIHGARCVDLFAGSGLLSFEALSRGAAHITLVENNPALFEQLQKNAQCFPTEQISLYEKNALQLNLPSQPRIDIVFIDPPFHSDLLDKSCQWLSSQNCLSPDALIYIEKNRDSEFIPPLHWQLLRQKTAGQVSYSLYQLQFEGHPIHE